LSHQAFVLKTTESDKGKPIGKTMLQSLLLFVFAGLCEIGGGYLFWLWLREGKSVGFAIAGMIILAIYGVVPTLQPVNFGRAYAAYGGVFIVLSILWGWKVDGVVPDRYDWLGGGIALLGVLVMMYAPRI
jgi:small multidrug resistance family-3 protein